MGVQAQTPVIRSGDGVQDGASNTLGPVAPGSLVSIYGTNLAAGVASASTYPLSNSMANVTVSFGAIPAPLYFVGPGQINVQVPWNSPGGDVPVVVNNNGTLSAPSTVTIVPAAPGFFTFFDSVANTLRPVVLANADGAFSQPLNIIPGLKTRPAKTGEALLIFATGLGGVNAIPPDGNVPPISGANTNVTPVVTIGGVPARVIFSGLTFVTVYQVNVIVDPSTPTGNAVPVKISLNGVDSLNPSTGPLTIAVTN